MIDFDVAANAVSFMTYVWMVPLLIAFPALLLKNAFTV